MNVTVSRSSSRTPGHARARPRQPAGPRPRATAPSTPATSTAWSSRSSSPRQAAARSPWSRWGPTRRLSAVQRALAMGAAKGVLVTDPALRGADALVTARVLAAAIGRHRPDLIIAGVGVDRRVHRARSPSRSPELLGDRERDRGPQARARRATGSGSSARPRRATTSSRAPRPRSSRSRPARPTRATRASRASWPRSPSRSSG